MTQTVSAQDVRNRFAEVLNTAVYGSTSIIITRFNKPQAVIMNYKEYERLMNPRLRFTEKEWEDGFKIFDRLRAKTRNIPPEQVEKAVNEAVEEVRKEKRVQGRR